MKSKNYLKSVLLYVCTFLAVVTVTAGLKVGWFFINRTPNGANGGGEEVLETPLTKVVNNVLSTEKMNLDLDLQLSSESSVPLKVSANIYLNMPTEGDDVSQSLLSNGEESQSENSNVFKVALKGLVEYDNQLVPYEISYLNGHIYAILGEAQFKIETENMMSDLNTILNFALLKKFGINISLPDLSQFSFSPELLSSIANQLTETDVDDKKEIKFNLMGYGWVTMVTDKDYNLQNILLSELDLNGTKISADVKADFSPASQEIVEPENTEDMTDLSGLTKFLQVVDTLGQKGNISGNTTLNLMNKTLTCEYSVNFEDFNNIQVYLKTKFINQDFVFIFKDHNAYISYLNCKYCFTSPFDFSEIKQALEFYAQKLGIKLPEGEFDSILDIVNVKDLNAILQTISNLKVDETGLKYNYNDLIIDLSILEGQFDKVSVSYKDILNLNINLNEEISIPEIDVTEYKNMLEENLFYLLNKQLIQNKNLAVKGEVTINGTSFEALLKADFKNEDKVQVKVEIFNRSILLTYINGNIYLEVDNILRAKGSVDEIGDFVKSLNILDINIQNIDFNQILQELLNWLDNDTVALDLIKVNGIVEAFEITETNVYCKIIPVEFEEITYQESGEYENLVEIGNFAKTIIDAISDRPLAFVVNAQYKDYLVTGKLQYVNNELSAILSTTIFEKQIVVEIENDLIYINLDGLKIKCSFDDIKEISTLVQKHISLDMEEITSLFDFDLDELLNNTTISLQDGLLNVVLKDIIVKINSETIGATFNYNDISGSIILDEPFEISPKQDYQDLTEFKKFLSAVDLLLDKGSVSGNVTLNLLDKTLNSEYSVDFKDFNNVKVYFKTKLLNKDFEFIFKDNTAYISFLGCKYCFTSPLDFSEIKQAVEFYAQKFGVELPNIDVKEILNNITNSDVATIFEQLNNITLNGNGLNYTSDDVVINLAILQGMFNNLSVSYKDLLSLNINLNEQVIVPEIDVTEYKNMLDDDLFNILNKQLIQDKNLSFKTEITVKDTTVEALVKVDFNDEIKGQIQITVLGRNILLTKVNQNVYLEIDNILRAKGSLQEVVDFAKSLDLIKSDSENIDLKEILQQIVTLFEDNSFNFNLIKESEIVKSLEVMFNDIQVKVTPVEFKAISYEESGVYQNLVEIGNFAKTIIDEISDRPLAFIINAQYKDYIVTGKLQYVNNELSAILSTTIFEKQIVVEIENDLIYINLDGLKIKCSIQDIKEIIEFVQNNTNFDLSKITPEQDLDINGILNSLSITMQDGLMNVVLKDVVVKLNAETVGATFNYNDISGSIILDEPFEISSKQGYYDFTQLKDLFKATIKTLENKSISGEVDVTLRLFNEDNNLKINYAVAYTDNKFIATIFTNFKGLNVNVYVDNEDIYLDIVGLKIKFNINNAQEIIDWANEKFNTNISLNVDELLSVEKLKDIHFDIIKNIIAKENQTIVEFTNGLFITVDYDTYVSKVKFTQDTREAQLTCTSFESINLDNLNREEYKDYTVFTDLIDTTLNLVQTKQFDISANVEKFVNNALNNSYNAKLSLDLTSALNAYLDITGLPQQVTAHYENKALYFCYGGANGMKIAIQENAIQEILGIVFSALNIDTSTIPLLDEFLKKDGIDTGNLETIMPNIEMSNPLSYLEYIKSFDVTDSYFEITLKGEKLGEYAMGKDITIRVNFSDSKITSLEINNLYTSDVSNEYINVLVKLNDFNGVETATEKEKYIDLSGSKDLLRAFVNTSNMKDWHVTGKVKLDLKLGSLKINAAELNVDINVKLDENTKPIIAVEVTNYPLVGLVNNKNTNGVGAIGFAERYRSISIYYANGELYLKTVDAKYGAYKELTRTTKITPKTLIDNLSYYVQYLLGFTDSIQTKIDDAIAKSQSYTGETDYGNIIQEYTHSGNTHTAKINLAELAHNSDIGTLSLVIKTINNDSTKNLDYIYSLDLDLNLLDSMIILKSDSSNGSGGLFLTDIGQQADVSKCEEIMNLYNQNGFALDGEYEKEGSKSWSKGNTGNGEITFISLGKEIKTITGEVASNISFPQMDNFVVDDDVTYNEYQFVGWYYDEEFTNEFTLNTFPRYSTTLFAKWQVVLTKVHATVNFEVGQPNVTVDSISGFVGETYSLPICENIVEKIDENTTLLKTFLGWFTEDGIAYSNAVFEQANLTLYAHWEEKQTTVYVLKVMYNGSEVYSSNVEKDTIFDLTILDCFKDSTLVYTSADFDEANIVSDFTVQNNTTWYLRNKFKVIVKSDITTLNGEAYYAEYDLYEGTKLDLTKYANFEKNNGTYTSEYTFEGYTLNDSKINEYSVITQNGDSTFVAVWTETQWCDVTFDVSAWAKPSWWTIKSWVGTPYNFSTVSNTNGSNKARIKRGSDLVFSNYVATCECKYKVNYKFKTAGWANSVSNIYEDKYSTTSIKIDANVTLQPVWQHA